MRLIPPVAVPSTSTQIAASLFGNDDASFEDALGTMSGAARVSLFPSGRSALSDVLSHWDDPERVEVVVPAYTCWSVAASIVRSGLLIRPVDVDPDTLDYREEDLSRSVGARTRAVVAAHLFARTADTSTVARVAAANGARWIDDAAQALPDRPNGADATVLSFGRGKPLALGSGGALLGGSWLEPRPTSAGGLVAALKLGVTALLARPAWYRLPQSIPALGIGRTVYDPDFDRQGRFYRWQRRLGSRLCASHRDLLARRAANAGHRPWRSIHCRNSTQSLLPTCPPRSRPRARHPSRSRRSRSPGSP